MTRNRVEILELLRNYVNVPIGANEAVLTALRIIIPECAPTWEDGEYCLEAMAVLHIIDGEIHGSPGRQHRTELDDNWETLTALVGEVRLPTIYGDKPDWY